MLQHGNADVWERCQGKKACAHGSRLKKYKACVTSMAVKGSKKMSKSLFTLEAPDTNRRKFGTDWRTFNATKLTTKDNVCWWNYQKWRIDAIFPPHYKATRSLSDLVKNLNSSFRLVEKIVANWAPLSLIKRFSNDCLKTNTKKITSTNHTRSK